MIRTIEVCRYYTRGPQVIKAVDSVSLSIAEQEFVAVVGSSGSGKSTLLNLLAGLDSPTSGSIEFKGSILNTLSRRSLSQYRAKSVGIMFQSFNLIYHRTALENVELALYFNGRVSRERRILASAMLERLGLADRMTHRPADLSGGEQQRVALARALVKQPAVLLADEPTGNLDQTNAQQIMTLLSDLNRQGLTVVIVTHDLEIAGKFAHRIVRMHYGQLTDSSVLGGVV
jgi:ABC-type lipoprotein export system ATPase subunit